MTRVFECGLWERDDDKGDSVHDVMARAFCLMRVWQVMSVKYVSYVQDSCRLRAIGRFSLSSSIRVIASNK